MNCKNLYFRYSVGLLDADVFGPSVPMMMNLSTSPEINHQNLIVPVVNYNVKCMSMGLLVDEKSPVSFSVILRRTV